MQFAYRVISGALAFDLTLIPTFIVFAALEALIPRQAGPAGVLARLQARAPAVGRAVAFWLIWTPFTVCIALAFTDLTHFNVSALIPSLAPHGLPRPLSVVIGALAAALVGDFFYYWCHRAQHRFFWRFHAVHHSVREMSGVAAYHHVTEEAFKLALYTVPLAFITSDPYAMPVLGALLGLHGNYLHSPIRLNFGPLGRVIQDNRFHRIHHSIEPRHYDKNFAVFCTLWDVLFGTACFPAPGEWPEAGVTNAPEPRTVDDFLLLPFRMTAEAAERLTEGRHG